MAKSAHPSWKKVGEEALLLGGEAGAVIGLRSARLVKGGSAGCWEAQRMVTEKIVAHCQLATEIVTGQAGLSPADMSLHALRHYRRWVRANRRRLSRP